VVVDGEGEASTETAMVAGGAGVDSARQRVARARERGGGDAGCDGAAWGAGIDKGWRGWPTGTPAMALLELGSTRAREEGEEEEKQTQLRGKG